MAKKKRKIKPPKSKKRGAVPAGGVHSKEVDQEISIWGDGLLTMGAGVLKALKGVVGSVTGIAMATSGLGTKDVYEVLNSPFKDWWRLWGEKRKKFNENRGAMERLGRGILGVFTGSGISILNTAKEILTGGFQALGGGIIVVKILKDYFGFTPEVIKAALKTGHPIGLIVGAVGIGVEKAEAAHKFIGKLATQLNQYESLEEVRKAALEAIAKGNIQEGIEQGAKVLGQATGHDFTKVGKQLGHVVSTGQQVYRSSPNLLALYRNVEKNVLPDAQKVVKKLGIDPKQLIAEKGKILFAKGISADNRVKAIKEILDQNPKFGIIAQAKGYEDALNKLVARNDLDLVKRLAVVNIIGQAGEKLSSQDLERLKKEALREISAPSSHSKPSPKK